MKGSGLALRSVVALELVAVGVELGVRSAFLTRTDVGLALGLAAPVAVTLALPAGWWRRFAFTLGWSVTVAVFSHQPAAGDIVIPGDLRGYTLVAVAVLVLMLGVGTLVGARPPADPPADQPAE